MVAYSFKAQFRAPILAGTKRQTIRADRKRHAAPGEQLQLYTGMRTKQCRLIGTAKCTDVEPVRIGIRDGWFEFSGRLEQDGRLDELARQDGFANWPEMQAFWLANHPGVPVFSGVVIRWAALRADAVASEVDANG